MQLLIHKALKNISRQFMKEKNPLKCELCGFATFYSHNLNKHMHYAGSPWIVNCGYALSNKHRLDKHIHYSGSPQRSDIFNLNFVNFLPLSRKGAILISVLWICCHERNHQHRDELVRYIVLKLWTVNNSTEGKIKLFRIKYNDANMILHFTDCAVS